MVGLGNFGKVGVGVRHFTSDYATLVSISHRRIEPNSTTLYNPRIRSKSVHPWASAEIFPGGKAEILLILFRLLTINTN